LFFSYIYAKTLGYEFIDTNKWYRVHAVEVLVAGKYVTREELAAHTETVLKKLDTIQGDIRSCMLHKRRKDDSCED